MTLERLSANQSNLRNHDEISSDYSSTNYKEYYAIIMAFAPNICEKIDNQEVKNRIKMLVHDPIRYMEESNDKMPIE